MAVEVEFLNKKLYGHIRIKQELNVMQEDICNKFVMEAKVLNLPHYTYDDYCQWEGRWELIGGIPFAMSPLPVPVHQRIGGRLFMLFEQALLSQGLYCLSSH